MGYEELYNLGKRIREKFPHLLDTDDGQKFYFRPTDTQRTVVSSIAFVNGLSNGTNLKLSIDGPFEKDSVIKVNVDRIYVSTTLVIILSLIHKYTHALLKSDFYIPLNHF